jgi:hypothetical protein
VACWKAISRLKDFGSLLSRSHAAGLAGRVANSVRTRNTRQVFPAAVNTLLSRSLSLFAIVMMAPLWMERLLFVVWCPCPYTVPPVLCPRVGSFC